jgi:hypothetical protein
MAEKKPLNLFIDTNVLLGFYRYSKDDLAKLNQLEDLIVKTKDIKLIVTSQQVDEFYRNRDKVIADVVKELSTSISIPQLFSGHSDYKLIRKQAEMIKTEVERVKNETLEDARKGNLKADAIISRLFKDATVVSAEIMRKAKSRAEVGNPPGKAGSLGDAINWELLLSVVPADEDLHIVSRDGDYASALDKGQLNSFLEKEWDKSRLGSLHLYETLNSLFKTNFPHIKLMDEYIKDDLIRQLSQSGSFDGSRAIIEKLLKVGNFSEKQIAALYKAATTNDQVYNAHKYSPDLVGDKLWQIIKPHWSKFSKETQNNWMEAFPDNSEPEDLPF